MSYSEVITKKPHQMTTEELRKKADADGLKYYRQQMEADPNNPQAVFEYERYCHRLGVAPNPEINRLKSLSKAQIAAEWTAHGKAIEAQEQDVWLCRNAERFMASEPTYRPTPEDAAKIAAEFESRGLRGTVNDFKVCFDYLVHQGDIQPVPQPVAPVRLPSMDEFSAMSPARMKEYIETANREGIL